MIGIEADLIETTKLVAVTLKQARVPFALAGGFAVYARGGPPSVHDTDFFLQERDAAKAIDALTAAGFSHEDCPEDWLGKVFHDGRMVDLIHAMNGRPVDMAMLERASEVEVGSVRMPVLDATDIVVGKLLAFSAHHCDFAPLLAVVRALREQIDWDAVRQRTAGSAYATAFLVLTDGLAITAASGGDPLAVPENVAPNDATSPEEPVT